MSRKYHLSYDAIDYSNDFDGNYNEAKRFLLCVLANTDYLNLFSYCESTFIIEYLEIQPKLFAYVRQNIEKYFYYSLSLVDVNETEHAIGHNRNINHALNSQSEIKNLTYNNLKKIITAY